MAIKAVQQIMLGTVTGNETKARETLKIIKEAGYDGIELNSFMVNPTPFMVRMLTKAAGMPTGKGGNLDWSKLTKEAGLKVVSLHKDLGSIQRNLKETVEEARKFDTSNVVITGMYRFDYRDKALVDDLCKKLDEAGRNLKEEGMNLLYHNHNYEFQKVEGRQTAYEYLIANTNPDYVGFEFDSYWPTEAGVNALDVMKALGERMKLYHINDRGTKLDKPVMTPILKSDSCELGYGNMNLEALCQQALSVGVEGVVLESHKNWIDKSPVKSLQVSAKFMNEHVK
ncbi:MAG: sugar phosphate isomerase/epimerase [Lachnospiraceae bacterium]|nr:sugar phosphate isomerase/epimerase [Lachnospiraceae bacterium]MDD6192959.1 sugar phosphate isomerase/epimerase [Lachnospiraceae bacterium]